MSYGQIVFYSGIGLLALTVITAVIFLIKKPRYVPENAAYEGAASDTTQRLRNGYPTDPLTVRREPTSSRVQNAAKFSDKTEQVTETSAGPCLVTERLSETVIPTAQKTEKLSEE